MQDNLNKYTFHKTIISCKHFTVCILVYKQTSPTWIGAFCVHGWADYDFPLSSDMLLMALCPWESLSEGVKWIFSNWNQQQVKQQYDLQQRKMNLRERRKGKHLKKNVPVPVSQLSFYITVPLSLPLYLSLTNAHRFCRDCNRQEWKKITTEMKDILSISNNHTVLAAYLGMRIPQNWF